MPTSFGLGLLHQRSRLAVYVTVGKVRDASQTPSPATPARGAASASQIDLRARCMECGRQPHPARPEKSIGHAVLVGEVWEEERQDYDQGAEHELRSH